MYKKKIQLVNPRVKLQQILNQSNISHPKAKELLVAIMVYICEQRELHRRFKHYKYYDVKALRNNLIDLSKESRIFQNIYSTVNAKYKKNKVFKKAVEDLIGENVIYPIGDNYYILNPLFYYDGIGFLNVYLYWCHYSKNEIENIYLEECVKEGDEFIELDLEELNFMVDKGIIEY